MQKDTVKLDPKGIFFDWDLTLVDSLSGRDALVAVINKRFKADLSREILQKLFSMSLWHAIQFLYEILSPDLSLDAFEKEMKKITLTINRDLELLDESLLIGLQDTYTLAIISNNEPENIEPILKKYPKMFDGLWAGPDHKTVKLQKALDKFGYVSDDVIYIGDHPDDIGASKEMGITSVAVVSPLFTADELATFDPDLVIQNLSELLQYLR